MSRFTQDASIDRVTDPKEQMKFISLAFGQLGRLVNNGLTFGDNFDAKILNATFSAATTNQALAHGLGRVPIGYIVISRSTVAQVYNGTSAWTSNNLFLASSAAGTVSLIVF